MLDELSKALGPWPLLQMFFGLSVLIAGIYAIVRGARGKPENTSVEDIKARWELQKAMGHLHDNSFDIVKLLEKANEHGERSNELAEHILAALNRINDMRWNRKQ